MNVAVVTSTSPYRKAMFDLTWPNHERYCKIHGYEPMAIEMEDGIWAYRKHEAFAELFDLGYELIAYKDDDSLITNLSIPYESFIDDEHHLFITKDVGGINGGSLILRNTAGGRWLNELILESREEYPNEQDCMNDSMNSKEFRSLVKVLPQKTINAYRYDLYPELCNRKDLESWEEGDFILHLPALTIERRIEIIKQTKVIE